MPFQKTCANPECKKPFQARERRIKYHTPDCGYRARQIADNEKFAERNRAAAAVFASEDGLPEPSADDPQVEELKRSNRRLMLKLADSKAKKDELVAAVYEAAKDAALVLNIPPVPKPILPGKSGTPEVALAVLADWQLAKATKTYNSEVCEERIEEYAQKVVALTKIQRAEHPVNEVRVYLLGDLVEGELIFPGQAHLIDGSLFAQVMTSGPRILGNFLRTMLANFDKVHVEGVIGNHGRLGGKSSRDYHPESNADAMMYEVTRIALQNEGRLTWGPNVIERERRWYAVDRVGKFGNLLFHGDQVKGHSGIPWYGFSKKVLGWATGAIPEQFNYAFAGHYHTPTRMLIGRTRLWVSGSTESDNTYAAEQLAAQGTPSQWLLFQHPTRGVTAEYEVHLGVAK